VQHIGPLCQSQITDLATLRFYLPGCTLVALDTEGVTQHLNSRKISATGISEVGVAVLQVKEELPQFTTTFQDLYEKNGVQTSPFGYANAGRVRELDNW
jgi:hypothetical protein